MILNTNLSALGASRQASMNALKVNKSMEKLSSGLRINRASDDAAGLAISEKMRAQMRGLDKASRNIQDGISLLQVADGGLNEIQSILQRGRELTVQASNDTLTTDDKNKVQGEANQLMDEIDRIANTTEFNGIKLMNNKVTSGGSAIAKIITGLKSGWLQSSVDLIGNYYGLHSSNRDLTVVINPGTPGGTLAAVSSSWSLSGGVATLAKLTLNIDECDFAPADGPNGTNFETQAGILEYDDRIIAHEMTHAVMADQLGDAFYQAPTWFKEGTAEFIAGADERLKNDAATAGSVQAIMDRAADLITGAAAWSGTSEDYSAAYFAVKYMEGGLHWSGAKKMSDLMASMKSGMSLNDALVANSGVYTSLNDFASYVKTNGVAVYNTLGIQPVGVPETDVGSIAGSEYGGSALNAENIIPDGTYNDHPTNFNVIFPMISQTVSALNIQLGANSGQFMSIALTSAKVEDLGLSNLDLVDNAKNTIGLFDNAINSVSSKRAIFGAVQNRLEHALEVDENTEENLESAESRIRDVDTAKEVMQFSKNSILSQAAQAMISQANQQSQGVLQLLR